MIYRTASISEIGGRTENQDCAAFKESGERHCWVVADGLGGHAGGATASKDVVNQVLKACPEHEKVSGEALIEVIQEAQKHLINRQIEHPLLAFMRTTIVMLVIDGSEAVWAHVGDTRLYHFHNNRIAFQTRDHSIPFSLADAGIIDHDQIRIHPERNRLLRSVGQEGDLKIDVLREPVIVQPGDAFLMCSDGFWEYVLEEEMEEDLSETGSPDAWLDKMLERHSKRIPSRNDNFTAIAVCVE